MRLASALYSVLSTTPVFPLLLACTASVAVGGCAGPVDAAPSDGDTSTTSDELSAHAPLPYVLQFVGTYEDTAAHAGDVRKLTLTRTGRYTAWIAGQTKVEHGAFFSPGHYTGTPAMSTLKMVTAGLAWTATIEGYSSKVTITRPGHVSHLTATGLVGPNEGLCDDSGGSWTDDDADPATGLYCICPAPKVYIASLGGCVN